MTENDPSSLWRASPRHAAHGEDQPHERLLRKMIDGIIRKPPVKGADGSIDLIEIDGIFILKPRRTIHWSARSGRNRMCPCSAWASLAKRYRHRRLCAVTGNTLSI
jgi:hypothetical protein